MPTWCSGPIKRLARRAVPAPMYGWLRATAPGSGSVPAPGRVRFGSLRRVTPISRRFGKDRGLPIDRYYIEEFLAAHAGDIRGRVLEIGADAYTRRFGREHVTASDVLHVRADDPRATIVADLASADHVPSAAFDCVVLTQTLPFIYDVRAAVRTLHRILKPGGVVLATAGGVTQVSRWDMERWGHYWSFTGLSLRRLFEEVFPPAAVAVASYGNVLAAVAFLHGIATQELTTAELRHPDPDYELIVAVRATRPVAHDTGGARE